MNAGLVVTVASAGTDMGFYLVKRLLGRAAAEAAVLSAEYDWHRDPEEPIRYPSGAVVPTVLSGAHQMGEPAEPEAKPKEKTGKKGKKGKG